jgi:hypothetical protein
MTMSQNSHLGASCALVIHLVVSSFCTAIARADRPTLTIALDDSAQSRVLKSELTRNWTQPNPALRLSARQWADVKARGAQLNAIAAKIEGYFLIVYATADEVPLAVRFSFAGRAHQSRRMGIA